MAAWFIPAFKLILPHLGTILSATLPVFTRKNADPTSDQALLQQQIAELQLAASQNATHIKELATQLQETVTALEKSAAMAVMRQRRLYLMSSAALLVSMAAVGIVLYSLHASR